MLLVAFFAVLVFAFVVWPWRASRPVVLPFTGLNEAYGVAVDSAGNVYVADSGNKRVLKLAAGATSQTELPFTGLNSPAAVAVDGTGNIYIGEGSGTWTVLPFTDLGTNPGLAVDTAGNLYRTLGTEVLQLPAGRSGPKLWNVL